MYPFTYNVDPTLVVKILDNNISMLLDTWAHVSVLPKQLIAVVSLPVEGHAKRHERVFGERKLSLMDLKIWTLQFVACILHIHLSMWMRKYQQLAGMIYCTQRTISRPHM